MRRDCEGLGGFSITHSSILRDDALARLLAPERCPLEAISIGSAKAVTQDFLLILEVYHFFGNIVGGMFSPILANAYLHELDEFVGKLRAEREKGKGKRDNPIYLRLALKKSQMVKRKATRTPAFKEVVKQMRATPSKMVNDPDFIRIKYLRYADDWLIGICGSHALAEEIKQQVKDFLAHDLHLTLSEEKTHITNARTEEASFLGTTLKIGTGGNAKITQQADQQGRTFKRRSTGWQTVMNAPISDVIKRLSDRGFCSKEGNPIPKSGWIYLDADQIIRLYSGVNRGIQNYYRFVDNWKQLLRIQYILEFSLAKTLAKKYRISVTKVFKRFGKGFPISIKGKEGREDRKIAFYLNHDWTKQRDAFQQGKQIEIDLVRTAMRMRTRSKLGMPCCICGETAGQIVMHHVRHVRKLTNKREAIGFNRILRAMNRKQIPVCTICHGRIHRGEYDDLKLSNLAYVPR